MNIVFVCQKGELELKSLLLAWSLRKTHGMNVHLIAACPDYSDWGHISTITQQALKNLSVDIQTFIPAFGAQYAIGNKISALGLLPANELGCFLDSDMLSLSAWSVVGELEHSDAAAKPADLGTWGDKESWQKVYALTETELPERRVRLTVSNTLSFPYFNAGFIATKNAHSLFLAWHKCALQLDSPSINLDNKYPWLDQISLPLAMQKTGSWAALTEYYNYPAHLRCLGNKAIGMCHYHSPNIILREPRLRLLFEKALEECEGLLPLVQQFDHWKTLLHIPMAHVAYVEPQRNFLITGIPRSGTSYLTSLLDSQKNWLVLNEPKEIFPQLQTRTDASGIELYYAECRERILLGQTIANKIKDGKVIEDTAIIDQQEFYHPPITQSDFWLGSKNTLAYIASLENLLTLNWPIIAMVRNPLDTLASWRKTFSHLANASVASFPVANPEFVGWSTGQRQMLQEIEREENTALRRVLLWRFLARTLLQQQDKIFLWRYEDLIENQNSYLEKFNHRMGFATPATSATTKIRVRNQDYYPQEREMLLDLCAAELNELDYVL